MAFRMQRGRLPSALFDLRTAGLVALSTAAALGAPQPWLHVLFIGLPMTGVLLLRREQPVAVMAVVSTLALPGGESVVAPRVTRRLLDRFAGQFAPPQAADGRLAALTEREREVLLLVAQGTSNAEIAEKLFVAEATVKTHVGRILTKLDLRDRVQAVVLAYETGLVRPAT
jgi:DNA-binding NarL/FixJ family response regulator